MRLSALITGFCLLLASGCAGTDTRTPVVSEQRFESALLRASETSIDSYPARELFFVLPTEVPCLSVSAKGTTKGETILKEPQSENICIILEKPVRIPSDRVTYYELARNFSSDWDIKENAEVCSSGTNPFQKLTAGIYRIRMSTFSQKPFTAAVTLSAQRARFFPTYDESDAYRRSLDEQRNKSK